MLQPFQRLAVVTYWLNMTIHSDICPSVPKVFCGGVWQRNSCPLNYSTSSGKRRDMGELIVRKLFTSN